MFTTLDDRIIHIGEDCSYEWREAIGEAEHGEYGNVEDIVHKRCRSQLRCAVMPHHGGVGESNNDSPELPYEYGQPETYDFRVDGI